jgi:hypothetical protein
VSLPLLFAVGVLLAMWTFLRRRRLVSAAATIGEVWTPAGLAAIGEPASAPSLVRFGLNRLGRLLLMLNAVALIVGVLLLSASGVSIDWATAWPAAALLSALVAVWLNLYFIPGAPSEAFVAEVLVVTFAMVLLTNVLVPMQYGALALGAPYADPWLARADTWLGASAPAITAWTWQHGSVATLARVVYFTFAPQMLLAVIILAVLRDRHRLWEFAFHFHVCLMITIAALILWPCLHASGFYGFVPVIDMSHAIAQIKGFHDGTMTLVRFDDLDGLVSVPSFHVAGALLVTWAFRSRPRVLVPLIVLNAGLCLSTVLTGEHYVIDVLAAVPLVAASVAAWCWLGRPLLAPPDAAEPC